MKVSSKEIAEVAMCSDGTVRQAISRGNLDTSDLKSVIDYCLLGRLKASGIKFLDDVVGPRPVG